MKSQTPTVPGEAPPQAMVLRERVMVRGVSIHLANEHAFAVDLFAMPNPTDLTIVCTNVRTPDGKRPVWADAADSIFYFPWTHIRFIEIPETALGSSLAGGRSRDEDEGAGGPGEAERELELEIDEDFLRRVRDV
jgi:hypothetical protein